jgi:hypothetical protein
VELKKNSKSKEKLERNKRIKSFSTERRNSECPKLPKVITL